MSQINVAALFLGPLLHVWSLLALRKPQTLYQNYFQVNINTIKCKNQITPNFRTISKDEIFTLVSDVTGLSVRSCGRTYFVGKTKVQNI